MARATARVLMPNPYGSATRFAPLPSAPHEGPVKPQHPVADRHRGAAALCARPRRGTPFRLGRDQLRGDRAGDAGHGQLAAAADRLCAVL